MSKRNRFHFSMHENSDNADNARRTPKRGKNISHVTRLRLARYFSVLISPFDVIHALSPYTRIVKWILHVFVN